ncbi:MAG TPA: glycosyltransferase [Longimicrobium sp.]|nr:glycosyltransferase [Longimicrobium sp.]
MRLGGFVIHGNSADTLATCLDGLRAVCDDVVAVDSGSTDGSADLVQRQGVRAVSHPWEGYGAARAAGARALKGCDYLLFLDSDEWLTRESIESLRRFKALTDPHPVYRLGIHDWAELPEGRFLFRTLWNIRLLRLDAATWQPRMIVHESVGRKNTARYPAFIEHRYATSLERRQAKEDRYALLWALRAYLEGKRRKAAWPQRAAHLLRNAVVKGALFRGGASGLRLSWNAAQYHARKYEYLAELHRGGHPELVQALREERYRDVFRLIEGSKHR